MNNNRCDLQFLFRYLPDYSAIYAECVRKDGSIAVQPFAQSLLWWPRALLNPDDLAFFGCEDNDAGPCFREPPPSLTSYGCYPIVYLPHGRGISACENGNVLCGDCAGKARDLAAYEVLLNDERTDREPLEIAMWQGHGTKLPKRCLVGEVFYEGPPEECGDCGKSIESAYGDPDAPDDAEDCHDDE